MTSSVKFRLAALSVAVAVMGAFIVLIMFASQRQGAGLRAKLDQVDVESFGLAEHFKDMLRESSDRLTHYRNTGDPAAWQDFLKANDDLNTWMQGQPGHSGVPEEKKILAQMNSALADYQRVAGQVREKIQTAGTQQNLPEDLSENLSQTRRRLFDLGQQLSQAHLELKQQLMSEAHQMLKHLRWSILGALGLLFLFGAALAMFVYRDMIAPLRNKLVETEALVEQQEKMASLGLLAAGVAHEIRNPLTAVKAALFTQQKRFAPGSPEYADVKVVEREISRLDKIVNDFLKFARPADPEMKAMAADLLLLETRLLLAPELEKQHIQIEQEPSAPLHVNVDPAQMKQVLINLVQNAAESIGRDGAITLRARHSHKPLLNGRKGTVILEVADTGKGIPPEAQKRIFDPFFTTKENGTGLGLSIAARIVEKHGGRLQYQTQVNRGTTFGILLPQVDA
jgi:signal transduction histidine kinase